MGESTVGTSVEHDEYVRQAGERAYGGSTSTSETADLTSANMVRESASSDLQSEENARNIRRRQLFEQQTPQLLQLIAETELEYGFTSELDLFLEERLRQNASVTREWLNDVFNRYFRNVEIATGILRTIAHLDWTQMSPQGATMALAALSHANVEVREAGVRAFENWGTPEYLDMLKSLHCPESWLQDYITRVVQDLEEALAPDAGSRKKD